MHAMTHSNRFNLVPSIAIRSRSLEYDILMEQTASIRVLFLNIYLVDFCVIMKKELKKMYFITEKKYYNVYLCVRHSQCAYIFDVCTLLQLCLISYTDDKNKKY